MVQKSLKLENLHTRSLTYKSNSSSGELKYVRIKFKHTFAIIDMLNMKKKSIITSGGFVNFYFEIMRACSCINLRLDETERIGETAQRKTHPAVNFRSLFHYCLRQQRVISQISLRCKDSLVRKAIKQQQNYGRVNVKIDKPDGILPLPSINSSCIKQVVVFFCIEQMGFSL